MKMSSSAESHKRSLLVLQLKVRRDILKLIGSDIKRKDEIRGMLELSDFHITYHLSVLEHAHLVEKLDEGYRLTPKAIEYKDKVEWL